jgi:cephalosporin hydroxylase
MVSSMTRKIIKPFAFLKTFPGIASLYQRWVLRKRVRHLSEDVKAFRFGLEAQGDLEKIVDVVLQTKAFRVSQNKSEIVELLRLVQNCHPKYICEIGAFRGGTLALFCQIADPGARILSIDLNYTPDRIKAFRHFARLQQRVTCLEADSHAPETLEKVEQWLHQEAIDFLLIDGDHSLAGVSNDFEMYTPYVRRGGIVALHDIVPDSQTRHGIRTDRFTGQVPEFWAGLKRQFPTFTEIIENREQDGYGIGVLYWQETPLSESNK